jgi:hypothetical protein
LHSEKYNLVTSLSLSNDIIFGFGTSLTIRPFIDVSLVFQCNSRRDFNVRFVYFSYNDFAVQMYLVVQNAAYAYA